MSRHLRPTPALVVACLAFAVALGGTGYSAIVLPARSVGTKQLKKGAVVAAKVKTHSLLAINFKSGQLRPGRRGPRGANGLTGAAGPAGAIDLGRIHVRGGSSVTVGDGNSARGTASCASGEKAISGGLTSSQNSGPNLVESSPNAADTGWTVSVHNAPGAARVDSVPVAVCVAP
jgi:hypothetical protein